ncbi:MAG: ester cyclase [Pseudomonadota bacterium]
MMTPRWASLPRLAILLILLVLAPVAARAETAAFTMQKDLSKQAVGMWAADAPMDLSIFDPGYQNHQAPLATGGSGTIDLETWARIVRDNHAAFPDLRVEILMQIAEDDRVATYWRFSGTQRGAYLGQPATDRRAAWTGVQIDRFMGGKIAESWVVWDFYSLLQELKSKK